MSDIRTPPPPAADPEGKPKAFTAWLGVLAALLTVVTAVLGVVTVRSSSQKDQAQTRAQDLSGTVVALQRQVDGLESQVRGLGATPSVSGASATDPAIYRAGTLALANNTCVDLDAPATDRQWGEAADYTGGGVDTCSQDLGFVGTNGAAIVVVNSGTDTTCQNATGWLRPNAYTNLHLGVGSFVCVHTNQDRFSLLRVDSIDSPAFSVAFDVKTFKKSGD